MLIRSQDKKTFINLDMTYRVSVIKNSSIIITADGITMGEYSTNGKALKVLAMLQEAYATCESIKCASHGLSSMAFACQYVFTTDIDSSIKKLEEYTNVIKEGFIFQMPTDSEVEV